jgi:hypothetical protein
MLLFVNAHTLAKFSTGLRISCSTVLETIPVVAELQTFSCSKVKKHLAKAALFSMCNSCCL